VFQTNVIVPLCDVSCVVSRHEHYLCNVLFHCVVCKNTSYVNSPKDMCYRLESDESEARLIIKVLQV